MNNHYCYINNKLGLTYKTSNYKYLINFLNKKNIRMSLIYNTFNYKCLINSNSRKIKNLNSIFYTRKCCTRKKDL